MRVKVGTKVTNPMPNGLMWPSIAISEETAEIKTVIDKPTGLPVDITVTRADFISLRETKEGEAYYSMTNEVVQYGRLSVAIPRFDAVVGLDADEDGSVLSLGEVMKRHAVSYGAFQASQFEGRRGVVAADDL